MICIASQNSRIFRGKPKGLYTMAQSRSPACKTWGSPRLIEGVRFRWGFSTLPTNRTADFARSYDTIPALAWVARPDGAAEFFNRRWLDYTGSSAEQAVDRGCIGAIHPDDRDSLRVTGDRF